MLLEIKPLTNIPITVEAIAIYKAVQNNILNKETSHNKYLILSDSLSSLTGINNLTNPTDVSKLIQETIHVAHQKGREISFLWIPGHCGIDGNELADQEASKAASSTDTQILNLRLRASKRLSGNFRLFLVSIWIRQWIRRCLTVRGSPQVRHIAGTSLRIRRCPWDIFE
ncbi:hypothetical protein QTP88_004428 [Uroleucon formosanum]